MIDYLFVENSLSWKLLAYMSDAVEHMPYAFARLNLIRTPATFPRLHGPWQHSSSLAAPQASSPAAHTRLVGFCPLQSVRQVSLVSVQAQSVPRLNG